MGTNCDHTSTATSGVPLFEYLMNTVKSRYLCIAEIFGGINFCQCSKVCPILYAIIQNKKVSVVPFLPMRVGGEIGENLHICSMCTWVGVHEYVHCT